MSLLNISLQDDDQDMIGAEPPTPDNASKRRKTRTASKPDRFIYDLESLPEEEEEETSKSRKPLNSCKAPPAAPVKSRYAFRWAPPLVTLVSCQNFGVHEAADNNLRLVPATSPAVKSSAQERRALV